MADQRPTIVLTEANLRALRLGYMVVTSEANIVVKPVFACVVDESAGLAEQVK